MAKGVLINLNSGSDYTDCAVYTGLTETTATGTTVFTSVTGGTINLSGLDDSLTEIYVKMVCVGCCEQIYYVCLTENLPTATPTPTATPNPTSTPNPTATPIPTVTPAPTSTSAPTATPATTPAPTATSAPTATPAPTTTTLPALTMLVLTDYELVSGGTTYYVSNTAPTATNAQTVYCQISDRESGTNTGGVTYRYHSNPLGVGTQLLHYTSYQPIANAAVYYNDTDLAYVGTPTGTTYYVNTDSNGYITDFVAMNDCWLSHVAVWSFNYSCTSGCDLSGASQAVTLYTAGSNNSWGNGVLVYQDQARTTYFPGGRYIKYQGYIWENDGANGLIEICQVGNPC